LEGESSGEEQVRGFLMTGGIQKKETKCLFDENHFPSIRGGRIPSLLTNFVLK